MENMHKKYEGKRCMEKRIKLKHIYTFSSAVATINVE